MTNNIFLNGICRPWNIHAGTFLALSLRTLGDAKGGDSLSSWREKFSQFVPQRQSMAIDPNGIAHIAVHGTLFNKEAPYFVAGYGGTNYEEIQQEIAVASKEARGIFLSIDSGGGHACGNDKVAKAIAQCSKPVFAYARLLYMRKNEQFFFGWVANSNSIFIFARIFFERCFSLV